MSFAMMKRGPSGPTAKTPRPRVFARRTSTPNLEGQADLASSKVTEPLTRASELPVSGAVAPPALTGAVEPLLGAPLEGVRLHHDRQADHHARTARANAITDRRDVYFAAGQFQPHTLDGSRLLVHELAHVLHQSPQACATTSRGIDVGVSGAPQRQAPAPEQAKTRPVIWGYDAEGRRLYVSVRGPGQQSLASIAAYLYADPSKASELASYNGIQGDELAPGRVLRLVAGRLSDTAHSEVNVALESGVLTRTRGIPSENEAEATLYRFSANGEDFELTRRQIFGVTEGLRVVFDRKASNLAVYARDMRDIRNDHEKQTNRFVRGISDWAGDTKLPSMGPWINVEARARVLSEALEEFAPDDPVKAGQLIAKHAQELASIAKALDAANEAWNRYIDATIQGGSKVKHGLEITRDVSFGIAIGIGAVVAFPVVAGALGTGSLATGGIVMGGGAATGATLRGGGTLLGEAAFNDSVDWRNVGRETYKGGINGALDAGVGLLAPGTGTMVSNAWTKTSTRVLGKEMTEQAATRLGQSAFGRFLLRSGTNVPSGALLSSGHAGLSTALTGDLEDVPEAMKQGAKFGAMFGVAGAAAEPLFSGLAPYLTRGRGLHGTSKGNASAIKTKGPEVRGGPHDDFGPGFYLTRDPQHARQLAARHELTPEARAAAAKAAELVDVPIPRRGTYLDLTKGETGKKWAAFLDGEYPGTASTRREVFFENRRRMPDRTSPGGHRTVYLTETTHRVRMYQQFLELHGLSQPAMLHGPLPGGFGPNATQIVVFSPQTLQLMHLALMSGRIQSAIYATQFARLGNQPTEEEP